PSPTRPTRPRRARSTCPCSGYARAAPATRCSRGRRTAPSGASPPSSPPRASPSDGSGDLVDDDVHRLRLDVGHPPEVVAHAPLHLAAYLGERRSPRGLEVDLDPDGAVLAQDSDSAVPVEVALDQPMHALDLACRVGSV